jgi:transcriptional regulator with XRE-family HTH domain
MARAALGVTIAEFAQLANVSTNTVVRFERGEELKTSTVEELAEVFRTAGITFLPDTGNGIGILYKRDDGTEVREHLQSKTNR